LGLEAAGFRLPEKERGDFAPNSLAEGNHIILH
jgi:hypothetical protein